jgi:hypothetical protein
MTSQSDELPMLVVDGANFSDFDGFAREFSRLPCDYTWRGNLERYSKPHVIEKKKSPRAASNSSA